MAVAAALAVAAAPAVAAKAPGSSAGEGSPAEEKPNQSLKFYLANCKIIKAGVPIG